MRLKTIAPIAAALWFAGCGLASAQGNDDPQHVWGTPQYGGPREGVGRNPAIPAQAGGEYDNRSRAVNRNDNARRDRNPPAPVRQNDPRGYEQRGYDQRGYDQRGYDQRGYEQRGYDQRGDDERGYDPRGYDPRGDRARGGDWRDGDWRGRGAGPDHAFYRGGRLPYEYRNRQYVVDDWREHRLSAPPPGYEWVQTGGDYVLVAISSGIIVQLLLGN